MVESNSPSMNFDLNLTGHTSTLVSLSLLLFAFLPLGATRFVTLHRLVMALQRRPVYQLRIQHPKVESSYADGHPAAALVDSKIELFLRASVAHNREVRSSKKHRASLKTDIALTSRFRRYTATRERETRSWGGWGRVKYSINVCIRLSLSAIWPKILQGSYTRVIENIMTVNAAITAGSTRIEICQASCSIPRPLH